MDSYNNSSVDSVDDLINLLESKSKIFLNQRKSYFGIIKNTLTSNVNAAKNLYNEALGSNVLHVDTYLIGITGVGKSTFFNWLVKNVDYCVETNIFEEEELMPPPNMSTDDLAKVGHSGDSCTSKAQECKRLWDTQGLNDNRGVETQIVLTLELNSLIRSPGALLFLFELSSIVIEKGKYVENIIKTIETYYGSKEEIKAQKNSFFIVITKINSNFKTLNALKHHVKKTLQDKLQSNFFDFLVDRIITFDPTNNPIPGGLSRQEMFNTLNTLTIANISMNLVPHLPLETIALFKNAILKIDSSTTKLFQNSNYVEASKKFQLLEVIEGIRLRNLSESILATRVNIWKKFELQLQKEIEPLLVSKKYKEARILVKKLINLKLSFRSNEINCNQFLTERLKYINKSYCNSFDWFSEFFVTLWVFELKPKWKSLKFLFRNPLK